MNLVLYVSILKIFFQKMASGNYILEKWGELIVVGILFRYSGLDKVTYSNYWWSINHSNYRWSINPFWGVQVTTAFVGFLPTRILL